MLHVAIKQAVKLHHHLLSSGRDILVFVVTDQVKLFVMDGLVCSFIDSAGIHVADGTEVPYPGHPVVRAGQIPTRF